MRLLKPLWSITGMLATVCVALGLLLIMLVRAPQKGYDVPTPPPIKSENTESFVSTGFGRSSLPTFSQYSLLAAQTVFRSSRQPPKVDLNKSNTAKTRKVVVTPPAPVPAFELRGVLITRDLNMAIVQLPRSSTTMLLGRGQSAEGWTLSEVTAERVIFTREGRKVSVPFPAQSDKSKYQRR